MARPSASSAPYVWCTTTANRGSGPIASSKASGFLGGDPVPPLDMNDILGRASDWIVSYSLSVVSHCTGNIVSLIAPAMAWVGDTTLASATYTPLTYVQIATLTGSTGGLQCHAVAAQGGAVNAVSLDTPSSNATNGTYAFVVLIYDSTHTAASPKYQAWTITGVTGDGVQTLAFDAGSSAGFSASTEPLTGPVTIVGYPVLPGGGTYVRVVGIRVQFATTYA